MMLYNVCAAILCMAFLVGSEGFQMRAGLRRVGVRRSTFSMTGSGSLDVLGLVPICLEASSSTTTTDDPTAGMSPDEITNYVSNVGGGLCGYPESVKTAIGLGLNLSLLAFGILTLGYIILGAWNFALERSVDDSIKKLPGGERLLEAASKENTRQGQLFNTAESTGFSTSAAFDMDPLTASQQVIGPDDEVIGAPGQGYVDTSGGSGGVVPGGSFENDGESPVGQSRAQRRLQNRLKKGEKD
jgi:hypothetical protein